MKLAKIIILLIVPAILITCLLDVPFENKTGIYAIWLMIAVPGLDEE